MHLCEMLPCPFSDHCAVLLSVSVPEPVPRGPGRWKLNISILKDDAFKAVVSSFWVGWQARKGSFDCLQSWWDKGKEKLKGLAVSFCNSKSVEKTQVRSVLVNLSQHLRAQIDAGRLSLMNIYESTLSRIASLDLSAAEGACVQSRTRWAEEGESSTHYFLRLEKKNAVENWISAMKASDGSIVSDVQGIGDSWVSFYSDLFRSCPTNSRIQDELLDKLNSFIPVGEVPVCEGHLSVGEVHQALLGMAKGKSPGSDGLPAEFYLAFGMFWVLT